LIRQPVISGKGNAMFDRSSLCAMTRTAEAACSGAALILAGLLLLSAP